MGVTTKLKECSWRKGFCFLWAIDDPEKRAEVSWNYLTGSAILFKGHRRFRYDAIPHRANRIVPDRVLNLNTREYSKAPGIAIVEGFAPGIGKSVTGGKLVVCSLDLDFVARSYPAFNIAFTASNQNNVHTTNSLPFALFKEYDFDTDLGLSLGDIGTPKFQLEADSKDYAMWAVFCQNDDTHLWGGNVWHRSTIGPAAQTTLGPAAKE
jgi:hypothetical protein